MFGMALGLDAPWYVASSEIVEGELHIHVDFEVGARFEGKPVHDTAVRTWRHLNFWQYPTYIHGRVPRCVDAEGKVKTVEAPWAKPGSGFTLLFSDLVFNMVPSTPVSKVAEQLKVDEMKIWRFMDRSVESARAKEDFSTVARVGVDETSCKKGHHYITTFVDLDTRRVLFACVGKGASTLTEFKTDLEKHGGKASNIKSFSSDMSKAFLSGIAESFPTASVVLDKFHLVKMVSEAVDATRRIETQKIRTTRGFRFLLLKNPDRLSDSQKELLKATMAKPAFSKTAECYRLRLAFQELFLHSKETAPEAFNTWLSEAIESGAEAMEKVGASCVL